ncbi:hypothetical protein NM208_g5165 [Fusarium decemcellulare]|uniref:Uncharacterized protein n=1 Tax=Fusarium decemcellulare TaxID=57161 RepID=A0ACC1SI52_9HYPO|nr:hypothetical protein NM208_g5165 [Fusarium decemcellulare]
MRFSVLFRVALGLLAVESAVAGPCRPTTSMTTSALTSSASTETSSATSVESTTSLASATSSASTEDSVETSESSTATSTVSVDTSTSTVSESSTETSTSSATTDFTTTTTTETTSTTSTAPEITFSIAASGSGPVAGKSLYTYTREEFPALFDYNSDAGSLPEARSYHIDSEGRLINDQGWYLCGVYDTRNNLPAEACTCKTEAPLRRAFLKCQVTADYKLTCSIPSLTCVAPDFFFDPPICTTSTDTWTHLTSRNRGTVGTALCIGDGNAPSNYSPLELSVMVQ